MSVAQVRLQKPLERMVLSGHPWLYRDALAAHTLAPGSQVVVVDKRGRKLAIGLTESGPIAVRLFSTQPQVRFGKPLLRQRIGQALALRAATIPPGTDAYRWLHGEGDRLPGLVCDRYGAWAVVKFDSDGVLAHRRLWAEVLEEALAPLGIRGAWLRASRRLATVGEPLFGAPPPPEVVVQERGMTLLADLYHGQKTGLFLDHRETRARVRDLSAGQRVLNLYGYTGGFSVAAGLGGAAYVTTVDVARPALALAERTFERNGLSASLHQACVQDVPEFLVAAKQAGSTYGLIVADPPNFAPSARSTTAAMQSYVRLHESCCSLVSAGGYYVAASCSSHVRMADFVETVREGGRRARRVLTVLEQNGAPPDYPRLLSFPEGDYLKVIVCRVEPH